MEGALERKIHDREIGSTAIGLRREAAKYRIRSLTELLFAR